MNPDSIVAYNNKGKVLFDLKRYTEAVIVFDKAINLIKGSSRKDFYFDVDADYLIKLSQSHNLVVPHYAVDAQRTPLRNRITGFLDKDVFLRCFVQGRPFFLGIDKGGGGTLYSKSSLTVQT